MVKDKNGKLYGVSYNDRLLSRYLSFSDELELCMRLKTQEEVEGLSEITLPNVFFTECIDLTPLKNRPKIKQAYDTVNGVIDRCDGIIVRLPSTIGRIAVKCCRKRKIPFLVEMVGCPWDALWNHSLAGKILALPVMLATKHEVKTAPAVIYVTNEFLQRRYPTKGVSLGCSDVVIPPVDEDVLERRYARIENMREGGKIVLGTAAAIDVKYKGQQYVIRAISELKKEGYDIEYHLAGGNRHASTYLRDLAQKLGVEENVIFCGSLNADQMPGFYDSLDIYIQPSKQEGLPRSVIEAMSRGVPCIGSNIAGIPELLPQECLFKKGNYKEICKCIRRLMDSNLKHYAAHNYEKAKEYNEGKLQAKREQFYRRFIIETKLDGRVSAVGRG